MVFSFFIAWLRQAQPPCYSRCLSLSKAEVHFFIWWFRLRSITVLLSVPEPVEGTFSLILPVISAPLNHRVIFTTTIGAWACRRHIFTHHPVISTSSITVLLSVPEPVEGTFSLIISVISPPSITAFVLVPEHRLSFCIKNFHSFSYYEFSTKSISSGVRL